MHFERFETRVRQIERNRDGGHAFRREPFVAQIAGGAEVEAARGQFLVELRHTGFQLASGDGHTQIANAPFEQLVVLESYPGWLRLDLRWVMPLHGFIVAQER